MEDARPHARAVRLLRRWWPWLAGVAILVVIATRVPLAAFRDAIQHGPHATLAAIDLGITALVLCTDSWSTWVGLIAARMRRPFAKVFAVRGATYLLFLLNYAAGQGGFGYYLYRTGASAFGATGLRLIGDSGKSTRWHQRWRRRT